MLSVRIQKRFSGSASELNVEFDAAPVFTIVFGASGAGKTTLLNCIAGIARPEIGQITAGETAFFDSERRICLPVAQRKIGYVFQDLALYLTSLLFQQDQINKLCLLLVE